MESKLITAHELIPFGSRQLSAARKIGLFTINNVKLKEEILQRSLRLQSHELLSFQSSLHLIFLPAADSIIFVSTAPHLQPQFHYILKWRLLQLIVLFHPSYAQDASLCF